MLTRDFSGVLADAKHAAKSIKGRCGELSDLLSRIAGEDVADLSTLTPSEFVELSDLITETIQAAINVLHNKAESERNAARTLDDMAAWRSEWPILSDLMATGTCPVERMADIAHAYPEFWQFHRERFA